MIHGETLTLLSKKCWYHKLMTMASMTPHRYYKLVAHGGCCRLYKDTYVKHDTIYIVD